MNKETERNWLTVKEFSLNYEMEYLEFLNVYEEDGKKRVIIDDNAYKILDLLIARTEELKTLKLNTFLGINNNIEKTNDITQQQPTETDPEKSLNWQGTQTEFIEMVKALIENGNIKGTQTEIIKSLSNVFNIKIKNENKLINDIKTRNNGSETLFIDKLKKTLFNYITLENKK